MIDDLLASQRYGEKWTSMWLDLARYADTKGFEKDPGRNIWQYRDWLISAFNEDQPYDKFLIEQLAGDLLPDPTDAQYIAQVFIAILLPMMKAELIMKNTEQRQ